MSKYNSRSTRILASSFTFSKCTSFCLIVRNQSTNCSPSALHNTLSFRRASRASGRELGSGPISFDCAAGSSSLRSTPSRPAATIPAMTR